MGSGGTFTDSERVITCVALLHLAKQLVAAERGDLTLAPRGAKILARVEYDPRPS